jgi:hypothetical protein
MEGTVGIRENHRRGLRNTGLSIGRQLPCGLRGAQIHSVLLPIASSGPLRAESHEKLGVKEPRQCNLYGQQLETQNMLEIEAIDLEGQRHNA